MKILYYEDRGVNLFYKTEYNISIVRLQDF